MRSLGSLLPLIVLAVLFYLLLIRPQRNRQRQAQALLSKVGVGDTVMTSGGMFGTVAEVEDDAVLLEVSPGVEVRLLKGAIQRIVAPAEDVTAIDDPDLLDEESDRAADHVGEVGDSRQVRDSGQVRDLGPVGDVGPVHPVADSGPTRPAGATRADGDLPADRR